MNIQDVSLQEQSSHLPLDEPESTTWGKKHGTGVQAACVMQEALEPWNDYFQ